MNEEDRYLRLLGLMFLGNICLIAAFVIERLELLNIRWIGIAELILVFVFAACYYISSVVGAKIFLTKFRVGILSEWVKETVNWNRRAFVIASVTLLFLVLFPVFTILLGDYRKVLEIYIYTALTGIVLWMVVWLSRK